MRQRAATATDASSLAALSIEVWLGTYLRHGINETFATFALTSFTTDRFRTLITDPANHLIVSCNRDGIDGFIRLATGCPAPLPGCSDTEIATLYVQPRHQGAGIGRALLQAGLIHARSVIGASSVWLTTNSENAPGIGFYLRQGFERIGTTDFYIDGTAYPNDVFRIPLTSR